MPEPCADARLGSTAAEFLTYRRLVDRHSIKRNEHVPGRVGPTVPTPRHILFPSEPKYTEAIINCTGDERTQAEDRLGHQDAQ